MSRLKEASTVIAKAERPPGQILEHLRDNFTEICRKKKATGEPEEQIMANWYAGVRICLALLREDRLIPKGLIQETDDFLEASLLPEFKLEIGKKKDETNKLIDRVLERKPNGE